MCMALVADQISVDGEEINMEIGDLREVLLNQGITAEDQVIIEGQTEPLVQSAEQAVFTPEGYVRRRVMRVTQCAGCLCLFHQAEAAGSVCVDCGRPPWPVV